MKIQSHWSHWLWLLLAIVLEVLGTSVMKISHDWTLAWGSELGLIIMWACLGIAYFALAKATVGIALGVTFALWDALGLVCIVAISYMFLHEPLTLKTSLGLCCVLLGGFLVHCGTEGAEAEAEKKAGA